MAISKNRHARPNLFVDGEDVCRVCRMPLDLCSCPECPVCGAQGNPQCLVVHFTNAMLVQVQLDEEVLYG